LSAKWQDTKICKDPFIPGRVFTEVDTTKLKANTLLQTIAHNIENALPYLD